LPPAAEQPGGRGQVDKDMHVHMLRHCLSICICILRSIYIYIYVYIYIYTHIYRQIERDNEISSLEYTHCNIHIHIINILCIYIYIYIFAFVHHKPELVKLGKIFHDAVWVLQRQLWMFFMQLSHQLVCSFTGKFG